MTDAAQEKIANFLDHETATLMNKAQETIGIIQQHRTTLISAVVTGKIDVRHFTPEDGQSPGPSNINNKEATA